MEPVWWSFGLKLKELKTNKSWKTWRCVFSLTRIKGKNLIKWQKICILLHLMRVDLERVKRYIRFLLKAFFRLSSFLSRRLLCFASKEKFVFHRNWFLCSVVVVFVVVAAAVVVVVLHLFTMGTLFRIGLVRMAVGSVVDDTVAVALTRSDDVETSMSSSTSTSTLFSFSSSSSSTSMSDLRRLLLKSSGSVWKFFSPISSSKVDVERILESSSLLGEWSADGRTRFGSRDFLDRAELVESPPELFCFDSAAAAAAANMRLSSSPDGVLDPGPSSPR